MDYRPHRELEVWKKAMDFVIEAYSITNEFPKSEEYGLTSQMRRASVSIPSNLAEGAGRKGNKEFMPFLNIAQGSETFEEHSILTKYKEGDNFNHRNTLSISRIEI
jgi:four helix bundle protein